ncbi:Multiple chloroplast division site [Thalictrum thalictroides]|uniref:Multiple chloroplast division site n=1 Tax=Thalictrum thalictroides TaxID=46969 RepID=A0A7J6X5G4_THATH|nr:Multiple chloroplast division site [Thalictrum thalictroides]
MASISTSIPLIRFQSNSFKLTNKFKRQILATGLDFRPEIRLLNCNFSYFNKKYRKKERDFVFRVCCSSSEDSDNKFVGNEVEKEKDIVELEKPVGKLQETVDSIAPILFGMKKHISTNVAVGLCLAIAFVVISIREYLIRKSRSNHHGSVEDLVKRGQLRSDRRGISRPLKYDDPFNNPLVKVSKSNSTVEMCGKVYRLAPVTLTEREQSNHQKRRSRAYQWKRPTIFLKEGDSIPPDVDPDTVRWIPANHPFATTVNDIDEDLAQSNVYQKRGVPFRIKAEHEALQKKLETLQNEQKLSKLVIDPGSVKDFERPFKSFSSHETQDGNDSTPKPDGSVNSSESTTSFDELQKP